MTSNMKRLGALAVAQCGAFVIVVFIGVFGGFGHSGTAKPTPSPSASHSRVVSPPPSPTPKKTGGQHNTTPPVNSPTAHSTATAHASATAHTTASPKTGVTPK